MSRRIGTNKKGKNMLATEKVKTADLPYCDNFRNYAFPDYLFSREVF
jgi:hypothetical protein